MFDHRERQGHVAPDPDRSASGEGSNDDRRGGGSPFGSVAFYLVLAAAAFLLWQMVSGNGAGPC